MKQRASALLPPAAMLAVAITSLPALANPTGPAVVSGTATVSSSGNVLQVTNSPNAIIEWQRFGIGAGEITRFVQQSAASAVLNRVTAPGASQILGTLQSNGRVFLVNPSGIVFGAGARVDVSGLVASSLNVTNTDFLAGRLRFAGGTGTVSNNGSISTGVGGEVYLLGGEVVNRGGITTPGGEVVLAAGQSIELFEPGTPNLRVEITAAGRAFDLGRIDTSALQGGLFAGLTGASTLPRATAAVATDDGRILLTAPSSVQLSSTPTASASGGTAAGDVSVTGTLSTPGTPGGGFVIRSGSPAVNTALNPAGLSLSGTGFQTVSNPGQPTATFTTSPASATFTGTTSGATVGAGAVLQ